MNIKYLQKLFDRIEDDAKEHLLNMEKMVYEQIRTNNKSIENCIIPIIQKLNQLGYQDEGNCMKERALNFIGWFIVFK